MAESKMLHFRVTAEQAAEIEASAKRADQSLSAYLRDRVFAVASPTKPVPPNDPDPVPGGELDTALRETSEQFIERRTRQLFSQGYTMRQARLRAAKEWDEAPS